MIERLHFIKRDRRGCEITVFSLQVLPLHIRARVGILNDPSASSQSHAHANAHLSSTCTEAPKPTSRKKNARYPELPFCSVGSKRDPIFYLQCTFPPQTSYFLRNEHPSVRRAFPPVGWQRTVEQPPQMTTVWACEKTVVMVKQPGHLTSMKNERGAGTRV